MSSRTPKAAPASVFQRLSSPGSSSVRSSGSGAPTSPTSSRRSPAPVASPKRLPPPKPNQKAPSPAKQEQGAPESPAQNESARDTQSTQPPASTPPPPPPPPEQTTTHVEERADTSDVQHPVTQPAPAFSAEEQDRIRELSATRDERRSALAAVEESLVGYALRFKAVNASERALHFQKRTEETQSENKMMKKDIDLLRNADRVMVTLRDTVDTMKKHYRIRTAHIRQKIATIELIAKRCREQREERVKLLDILQSSAQWIEDLAVDELGIEQRSLHVDPLRNMAFLLRRDGVDEEFIEATIRDMSELQSRDVHATVALQTELGRLQTGIELAADDSSAVSAEISAEWEDTKARMLYEYQRLCVLNEELGFHVRRGTHIKTTAQLPETLRSDEVRLRELLLSLSESQEALQGVKRKCTTVQEQLRIRGDAEFSEVEQRRLELEKSARVCARLEDANHEWRARYSELQQEYVNRALGGGLEFHVIDTTAQPVVTDHRTPRTAPESVADRLFATQTKSRQLATHCVAEEGRDRKLRSAAMRWRPVASTK